MARNDADAAHVLGVGYLVCGIPYAAVATLHDALARLPDRIPLRFDLATALVYADRPARARSALEPVDGLLSRHGPSARITRWLDELRERKEALDRAIQRRALEHRFLQLRAAAWAEISYDTRPTETALLHARTLMSLGELEGSVDPYQDAANVLGRALEQRYSIRALEMLAEVALAAYRPDQRRPILDLLQQEHRTSAILRGAREMPLEERELAALEAEHEARFLLGELCSQDRSIFEQAFGQLYLRRTVADHHFPYLNVLLWGVLHMASAEVTEWLSQDVADDPRLTVAERLSVAAGYAEAGYPQQARVHAELCLSGPARPDEAAAAESLLRKIDSDA
ncbi:hypothetical protein [Streptomyces sp. ID05-47C]|uniref:hypothetical protein n=1 Tax=Streptomyces sp. ID05-47C TaxID=3028665 RepID=UPI0029AFD603|nr:hypothetical protein [Streptomyces sp. ID05-47C]MDX3569053.1 hypothetical protein [Streptomyces sp. ID05-47C]